MVASTEQTPVPAVEDVRVIAIKLPSDPQERLLAFPFLHAVAERWPKANLHFITPKKEVEVLNLLPFKAFYHVYDEGEINNIFDVHRYCATNLIYNVDIFFSLTDSFVDACLGFGLRAKKRVGYADGWNKWVLSHKTLRPRGHHITEDYYALYQLLAGSSPDRKLRVTARTLSKVIEGEDPYIAINLAPLRGVMVEEEMLTLINEFEAQKIVLFSSEDQAKVQLLLEPFLARLNASNEYVNYIYSDWIELGKMLAFSTGVITFNGACATLSAYVNAKTLVMFDSEDPQRYGPFYSLAEVVALGVNDPTLTNSMTSGQVLKDRKTFNMVEVANKAKDFFRL